jgi:hypothetical protein
MLSSPGALLLGSPLEGTMKTLDKSGELVGFASMNNDKAFKLFQNLMNPAKCKCVDKKLRLKDDSRRLASPIRTNKPGKETSPSINFKDTYGSPNDSVYE